MDFNEKFKNIPQFCIRNQVIETNINFKQKYQILIITWIFMALYLYFLKFYPQLDFTFSFSQFLEDKCECLSTLKII